MNCKDNSNRVQGLRPSKSITNEMLAKDEDKKRQAEADLLDADAILRKVASHVHHIGARGCCCLVAHLRAAPQLSRP